jgi:hypothetical protein
MIDFVKLGLLWQGFLDATKVGSQDLVLNDQDQIQLILSVGKVHSRIAFTADTLAATDDPLKTGWQRGTQCLSDLRKMIEQERLKEPPKFRLGEKALYCGNLVEIWAITPERLYAVEQNTGQVLSGIAEKDLQPLVSP